MKIRWKLLSLLLGVFLICSMLAIHILPKIISAPSRGLDLTESQWEICSISLKSDFKNKLAFSSLEECNWEVYDRANLSNTYGTVIGLRTFFSPPESCQSDPYSCHIVIQSSFYAQTVYLNGHDVGTLGNFSSSHAYGEGQVINFELPLEDFEANSTKNELSILAYNPDVHINILDGKTFVVPKDLAFFYELLFFSEIALLPLVGSFICFMISLFFLSYISVTRGTSRSMKLLALCTTIAGFFLLSMTRIPRLFIPYDVGLVIHFSVRYIYEYCTLIFLFSFYNEQNKWILRIRWLQALLFIVPFYHLLMSIDPEIGNLIRPLGMRLYGMMYPLVLTKYFYAIANELRTEKNMRVPLVVLCAIFIFQLSDMLVFLGVYSWNFSSRFFHVLFLSVYSFKLILLEIKRFTQVMTDAEVGSIASRVAHDVRAPLAVFETVLRGMSDSNEKKLLESAGERIRNIADDLLTKRRYLGKGEQMLSLESLIASTEKIIDEFQITYPDVELHLKPPMDRDIQIYISIDEFSRIVQNIVQNAIEATLKTTKKAEIVISFQKEGELLRLEISDNGSGVPSGIGEKIFEKDFSSGKPKGNGLGLYHSKQYLESVGGEIEFRNNSDSGATFRISLKSSKH